MISDLKVIRNQHITLSLVSDLIGSIRFDNETENYRSVTIKIKHSDSSVDNLITLSLDKFEELRILFNRFNIELGKVQEIKELHPTWNTKSVAGPIIVESNHPLTPGVVPVPAPAGFISHQ